MIGLSEYIPKVEDGRTILDILALEAMSKLQHFNSQDLSNMLWSYAKVESSNSVLFKTAGDLIVGMNDLSEFEPQHWHMQLQGSHTHFSFKRWHLWQSQGTMSITLKT